MGEYLSLLMDEEAEVFSLDGINTFYLKEVLGEMCIIISMLVGLGYWLGV